MKNFALKVVGVLIIGLFTLVNIFISPIWLAWTMAFFLLGQFTFREWFFCWVALSTGQYVFPYLPIARWNAKK